MPYLQQVPIEAALTAAARSFFSKTLDAAGAQPDDAYASTAPLLDLFPTPQGS
jgi:hypothetical protein